MNILITGGKNAKVLKLLKAFSNDFIVFGDYGEVPEMSARTYRLASLGIKNEQSIAHVLLDFCLSESIELIIPTHRFEIEQMAKSIQLFSEYDITVLLPSAETLDGFLSEEKSFDAGFVVLKKGKCIFSSTENAIETWPAELSGVFELQSESGKMKLFLV